MSPWVNAAETEYLNGNLCSFQASPMKFVLTLYCQVHEKCQSEL